MTIAKKHAQQYMQNGEVSLEQVIQAAINEAESLLIVGARERVRDLEWANDKLKDHAIALQERIRQLEVLREECQSSNDCQYGTLSTSHITGIIDAAIAGEKNHG